MNCHIKQIDKNMKFHIDSKGIFTKITFLLHYLGESHALC